VSIIQSIHWGSSIILFIAALGFSLGGALLPWYQRPFWAMIFITTIIGGVLAVANLSFAYLYAEWHDPLPPSHLFILHMLLSPVAIAGTMNIVFMVLRKRGETS
jgi:quinol-cytochrome oxidoreductase complex cytochrome b subunit